MRAFSATALILNQRGVASFHLNHASAIRMYHSPNTDIVQSRYPKEEDAMELESFLLRPRHTKLREVLWSSVRWMAWP